MGEILEAGMMVCFGISWPASIWKSYTSRTAKGRSGVFFFFIIIGYLSGIAAKLMTGRINYVLVFYVLNTIMILIDCGLFLRNRRLDAIADAAVEKREEAEHVSL